MTAKRENLLLPLHENSSRSWSGSGSDSDSGWDVPCPSTPEPLATLFCLFFSFCLFFFFYRAKGGVGEEIKTFPSYQSGNCLFLSFFFFNFLLFFCVSSVQLHF